MKTKWILMAGFLLFACLLFAGKALTRKVLYPVVPSNAEAAFESDSEVARKIVKKLPKRPRLPVAIAIIEKISGKPSQRLISETTLHYYLDSSGFPVRDGENALLREYAGFYFTNKPRDFPLTLVSKYYIIGAASAEPGEDQSGLTGARAELEIYALDRQGKVFYGRKVRTESLALSLESAEIKALKAAVSEVAIQLLPMLK